MTITRKHFTGLIALNALLASSGRAIADTPKALRIGTAPNDSYSEVFYAQENGFFTEAGLDATLSIMQGGATILGAVVGGALDIGACTVSAAANAHLHGLPVYFIAPGGIYTSEAPIAGLLVPKTSSLRTGRDFEGKTVAVTTIRDTPQVGVMAWVDKTGGDSSKVSFTEVPAAEMGGALELRRVDAVMAPEPNLTELKTHARYVASPYDYLSHRYMSAGWVATKTFLESNLDTVMKFAAVMRRTAAWIPEHRKQAAAILAKYTHLSIEIAEAEHHSVFERDLDPKMIQPVIDACAHYMILPQSFPASELFYSGLH